MHKPHQCTFLLLVFLARKSSVCTSIIRTQIVVSGADAPFGAFCHFITFS